MKRNIKKPEETINKFNYKYQKQHNINFNMN